MFCSSCGSELSDDAIFCGNCGSRVESETAQAAVTDVAEQKKGFGLSATAQMPPIPPVREVDATQPPSKKPKDANRRIVILIVAIVIVLAGLGTAGVFLYQTYLVKHDATVTFETSGGSVVSPQTVKIGAQIPSPQDPTKDGYSFAGWFNDAACTQQTTFPLVPQNDMTVYAKWTAMSNPDAPSGLTYSDDVSARKVLKAYYDSLDDASDKVADFVKERFNKRDTVYTIDYATLQSDSTYFSNLTGTDGSGTSGIFESLRDEDGNWTVSSLNVPSSYASVQSNLVEASDELKARVDGLQEAYSDMLNAWGSAASQVGWENIYSVGVNADHDAKKKYDAAIKKIQEGLR